MAEAAPRRRLWRGGRNGEDVSAVVVVVLWKLRGWELLEGGAHQKVTTVTVKIIN